MVPKSPRVTLVAVLATAVNGSATTAQPNHRLIRFARFMSGLVEGHSAMRGRPV
jgi:hypothetical protein